MFYDEGWIARCDNKPFNHKASIHWKDGWKDCDEVNPEERISGRKTLEVVNENRAL